MSKLSDIAMKVYKIEGALELLFCKCGHHLSEHSRSDIGGWNCNFKIRQAASSMWNRSPYCGCDKFKII